MIDSGEDGNETNDTNFEIFREVFFGILLASSDERSKAPSKRRHTSTKGSKNKNAPPGNVVKDNSQSTNDPAELADFSDYIAREVFDNMPHDLQSLSYQRIQDDSNTAEKWSLPLTIGTIEDVSIRIPPSVTDSLTAYGLIEPPKTDLQSFMWPVITGFVSAATTPPPKWTETRATACEICERDWVLLTYHHLIPRGVHAKVLKRGWHDESMLNSVAWLCRACHTFVHKMASNEELAREWYTVDKICSREDVQKWANWVGRVRWKKR